MIRRVTQRHVTKIVLASAQLAEVVLMSLVVLSTAQAQMRLAFEAASVKQNNSGSRAIRMGGGLDRFSAENVTLRMIMSLAYDLEDFQILQRPEWVDAERYDIQAKAEGKPTRQDIMNMLQVLVEDRFKLAFHRDKKELPVYLLTIGKNGPALAARDCITRESNVPTATNAPDSSFCGYLSFGNGNTIRATSIRMGSFADVLTNILKRKVIDTTGFESAFDVSLNYSSDLLPNDNTLVPADLTPSIFTALQEQLGLKLESGKRPVDVLVIDHVERPTEN